MPKAATLRTMLRNLRSASMGRCPICGKTTVFALSDDKNLREGLQCVRCGSIGRNRLVALGVLEKLGATNLPTAVKAGLGADVYIAAASGSLLRGIPLGTPRLTTSEFVPGMDPGEPLGDGFSTCQNLEDLTYPDSSFDVVVTEDVLEHVRDPDACHREIFRVLRPGGMHVFSAPFHPDAKTLIRVDTSGPDDVHLMEEEWHGDSIRGRILAYRTFGYDLFEDLSDHGFKASLLRPSLRNRTAGIHDAFVFVATKVS